MTDERTVLVIDDDEQVRRAFRRVLESGGFQVREAEDGVSGLAAVRQAAPNAVLLDLRMPGMDGLEVLSELVASAPDVPVLVVSGEGTVTDVVGALRGGAWDFVTKPVSDRALLTSAVERVLEKARLLKENRAFSESLKAANLRLTSALDDLRADKQAARQLQFHLLPEDGLRFGGLTWSRRMFPARYLSGDFVDYFPLGEQYAGFYVADVAGHGAASAFVTAILTMLVQKHREHLTSRGDETILHPGSFLARLNAELSSHGLERHVTMFYGVIDRGSGRLVFSNAGAFPYPVLVNGSSRSELECVGRPLNLLAKAGRFAQGEAVLEPGGKLLIASDGVLELGAPASHEQKRAELAEIVASAEHIDHVLAALGLDRPSELDDDVAILFPRREES